MEYIRALLTFLIAISYLSAFGQANFDECQGAIEIDNLSEFCSQGLTNEGATPSDVDDPFCWRESDGESDVWLTFFPREQGLLLNFFGSGEGRNETIRGAAYTLYRGRCGSLAEVDCELRDLGQDAVFERLYSSLLLGQRYYIRISSPSNTSGTFQLCLNSFTPVPEPQQDCETSVLLCDKSPFVVSSLEGGGRFPDEARGTCLDGSAVNQPSETGSAWYKWTVRTAGNLTFTLFPNNTNNPQEDLDFAIYRLPNGINDCNSRDLVRCMASGRNPAGDPVDDTPCFGPTGLMIGDPDLVEEPSCQVGDNNFLAALDVQVGESYALLVNNFTPSGFGFSIEWGGSAEFLGPEADFDITALDGFECDREITFESTSTSSTDPITSFEWQFGDQASTPTATGSGPLGVTYETFGEQLVVLTVETERGCQLTEIKAVDIDTCCADPNLLELTAEVEDQTCPGSGDGRITPTVANGSPEFQYSLDQGAFQFENIFENLISGNYNISVIDIKGCRINETFVIGEPEPIEVSLSALETSVTLGEGTELMSSFTPPDLQVTYVWTPPQGLSCSDCPNPSVVPPGTTTYLLTVTDEDGCMGSDDITITAEGDKLFLAPNIISLSAIDVRNSIFEVTGNIAVQEVETFEVYDRWGGRLFKRDNIDLFNGSFEGWNGQLDNVGAKVNPGVFVWIARVRFVDGEVVNFAGDLTVID